MPPGEVAEALGQKQRALLLPQRSPLRHQYNWLDQIYHFVHNWSSGQLESMKGWPAEEYVNQILKLRAWASQVQNVPRAVITYNRLLFCRGSLPLLASINEDILALLLSETLQRSELLITELAGVLQLYMTVGTDIFTVAKCSQKVALSSARCLTEYVDYVRALNEVIQHRAPRAFSVLQLLDTWDAFVYQQREVSDFIISRRLNIIAELHSSLQKATRELQELLAMVTVGRFQDPSQNPRAMEDELHQLACHFQATVARVTDLCRSQRILTGKRLGHPCFDAPGGLGGVAGRGEAGALSSPRGNLPQDPHWQHQGSGFPLHPD
uniref:Uncharacterized protein n=1 Tax=Varanus komodoensis TaxID=61221 RepID=A0A8D2L4V2_VARKO